MNKYVKILLACIVPVFMPSMVQAQIDFEFEDTYYVKVSYTGEESFKRAALQIIENEAVLPVYAGECKDVIYDEETGYSVNFGKIKLSERLEDGTYIIKVGTGKEFEEVTFDFENTQAKTAAFERLEKAESGADVKECLDDDYMFLNFDYDKYLALNEKWRMLLSEEVFNGLPYEGETEEERKAAFAVEVKKLCEIISFMCAKNELPDIIEKLEFIVPDTIYYDKLTDKAKITEIYSGYTTEEPEEIDETEALEKFDGAVLCAVIISCDFGTASGAIDYYVHKGIIEEPDKTYYSKLSDSKKAEVFDKLKSYGITDYKSVTPKFEIAAKEVYDKVISESSKPVSRPSSGGGSSGGSSSGGGGSFIIYPQTEEPDETDEEETNVPETEEIIEFPDMNDAVWAKEAVSELAKSGCVSGDENGFFNPDNNITREEFVKIAVTAFGMYMPDAKTYFSDVKSDAWYYSYIASGVKSGLINGISEEKFGTGMNITRQDATVILYRLYESTAVQVAGEFIGFTDEAEIADYAKDAVCGLSAAGVITGMDDGSFCPQDNLTRAEAAVLIYRLRNITE